MSVFADSSALVKLYADEAGAAEIRGLDAVVVSCLARVEVPAAIWRKHRLGELGVEDAATLIADFEADYHGASAVPARFIVVGLTEPVLIEAACKLAAHGLRAYDAIQLAAGLLAHRADVDCAQFACFDEDLRAAAAAEGMRLVPAPSSSPGW